ncbi:zinc finger protein hangover isoform X3 [Anopheles gambiae]|uniref:zinc finger protein hangover isoform X3 n=1 Tax=Anopheles gambiae TaxID=7165 RepID=UPI002AC9912A|nr:zinc finger protein hangover isoform X3 [Anopheles gambiae]
MKEICLDIDLHKVCRICLSQTNMNEALFNIFADAIVDGRIVPLVEVIESCVGIQVKNSQELPSKICHTCKSIILQFHVFKQKCSRAESVLREMLLHRTSINEHIEEGGFLDSDYLEESKSVHSPLVEYIEETIEEAQEQEEEVHTVENDRTYARFATSRIKHPACEQRTWIRTSKGKRSNAKCAAKVSRRVPATGTT